MAPLSGVAFGFLGRKMGRRQVSVERDTRLQIIAKL